jgi:hypothetical protein
VPSPAVCLPAAAPWKGSDDPVNVTISLVLVFGIAVFISWRYLGLRLWQLVLCVLLGFLLRSTAAAPEIQSLLTAIIHWGLK